ncbi:MAG: MaoC/PaaZ C-terminal domain-containing protein [Chloroflexota bacterium]
MEKRVLNDYSIGEKFVTPARTITESDFVLWSALVGDWTPLHTDAEYMKKSIFGERIAHGFIAFNVSTGLAARLGPYVYTPKELLGFEGWQDVRFTAPVKIGDTIHVELTVKDLKPKDKDRGILTYETKIINQREEMVMIGTQRLLVKLS